MHGGYQEVLKLWMWDIGFYMAKLDQEIDRLKVVNVGPWMIYDHDLTVRTWSPEFVSSTTRIDRTLV
jgi:hypothetical protein